MTLVSLGAGTAHAQDQNSQPPEQPAPATDKGPQPAEIIVSGVRQSIESAIGDKQRASEIKDSITAEDIGQLANDNISEALQRIPGVQVDRSDDGEGRGVQIRGLSENNVQLNGQTMSGTAAGRGVNFQDLAAELFSGVEILKATTADQIEGSLGGTINLKTRSPLAGKRDFVLNINGVGKYAEVGDVKTQDFNVFLQRQFRDTGIGDIGVILNFGYKETASFAEVYGGGDFETAPGIWLRKTGADIPQNNPVTTNTAFNFFFQPTISSLTNPYRYDLNEDPNGDGVSDARDIYYVPGQFGFSERRRDDTKKSFNGTLEWRPADSFRLRFDAVLTDVEENLTGSNYSINSSPPRVGVLLNGPGNVFSQLGSTPTFGNVYVLESGRLASFTNRVGAAPSANTVARDSKQYALEMDWEITSNLKLTGQGSTSRGKAGTVIQGQLNTGIDHQGGAASTFNTQDFYNFIDFSLGGNQIPNVTFFESPFPAPNYGVPTLVPTTGLVTLNPADINYVRQRYFQYQRNASDTRSSDDSVRFDLTWEPQGSFFTAFGTGFRWADRSFERASYQNANQNSGVYTAWDGVRAPVVTINIQRVPVNPASTTDALAAATSAFLAPCITGAGRQGMLSQFGGNLPTVWNSTSGCDFAAIERYFNMIDIRAVDPATGVGYYAIRNERFDVGEETLAGYLRADFRSGLFGGIELFGNAGVRYVKTKTSSREFIPSATTVGAFDNVTLKGEYGDWLPSLNLNFALTNKLVLRTAYSRTLGRPGLSQISGLQLIRSDTDPTYDGFGSAGNPDLEPVRSDNFDASLEWYYDKGSYLSVALFKKNIDTTIFLGSTPVDYPIGNELFSVRTYGNFGGTRIKGLELGAAHAFRYLPGFLRHFGVTGNFTVIDESSDLRDQEGDPITRKGLSKRTLNLGAYWDNGKFSARLAYNKRSEFVRRENVSLGFQRPETLPEIEAGRDQLDLALRYKVNRNLQFTFNAINLTDTGTVRYMKYEPLVNYLAFAGRKFNLGATINF
jgi:TonB-dependent receptor